MRAWIEMALLISLVLTSFVALYMRAWIEIIAVFSKSRNGAVALYMRAWIEIQRRCIIKT